MNFIVFFQYSRYLVSGGFSNNEFLNVETIILQWAGYIHYSTILFNMSVLIIANR